MSAAAETSLPSWAREATLALLAALATAFAAALGAALALSLAPVTASAQPTEAQTYELNPERAITHFMHKSWQEEDGLPQNTVDAIVQGERGYLWLATQVGLVRFDGVSFRVFDKANVEAIQSNQIQALFKDRSGAIWIGTDGGGLTRLKNGSFRTFTTEDGLSSNVVRSIYEDGDGNLWIGTRGGGLVRYDGDSFTTYTAQQGVNGKVIISILRDSDGTLLVGTDAGLHRLHNGRIAPLPGAGPLGTHPITALHPAPEKGGVWVGTAEQGLYRWDGSVEERLTEADGLSGNNVVALFEDRAGALWVGLQTGGLNRIFGDEISVYQEKNGLTQNHVTAIYQDREHSLWVGTNLGGLNQLRDGKFTTYTTAHGLSSNIVYSVIEDRDGAIWVGTDGGGVNRIDDGRVTDVVDTEDGLPSNIIYSLAPDPDGGLWIGTLGGGICRYRGSLRQCLDEEDGLANNVYVTFFDSSDRLWVGTRNGLARVENGRVVDVLQEKDGLVDNWVTSIAEDGSGGLWIGTFGGGISHYENGSFTNYTDEGELSSSVVLTLEKGRNGTVWAGTQRGGLCRIRRDEIRCLTSESGLFTDDILQILRDDQGYLWLGALNGIGRIPIDQIHERIAEVHSSSTENRSWPRLETAVYGTDDGLASSETNGGIQPAAWRTRDGRLLFSTIEGLAVTRPSRVHRNEVPPAIVLERVFVEDEEIPVSGEIELPPGSRRFEFHYTGISFIASEDIQFRYRLTGYDDEWIDAETRREAYYTNLSPGEYEFEVVAVNSDGVASQEAASLSFYVQPYFYQTYWFYLLAAGGLFLLGVGAYHLRTRQLRKREEMLNEKVEEQTRELRQREQELKELNDELEQEVERQLDVILAERRRYERELIQAKEKAEESARLKTNILMNMSHEIRTPLATILGFSEELKESVDGEDARFVSFIQRSSKRLLDTLSSVLEMSKLQSGSKEVTPEEIDLVKEIRETVDLLRPRADDKNLELTFDASHESVQARLDPSALHRIVNNLVGNAVKFTEEGRVEVQLAIEEDEVELRVSDTGRGIEEEFQEEMFQAFKQGSSGAKRTHEGTGLGLAITRQLVDLMDGSIEVESEPGRGSTFRVRFPIEVEVPAPTRT